MKGQIFSKEMKAGTVSVLFPTQFHNSEQGLGCNTGREEDGGWGQKLTLTEHLLHIMQAFYICAMDRIVSTPPPIKKIHTLKPCDCKDFQLIESDSTQMMKDNPLYLKSTGYEHE